MQDVVACTTIQARPTRELGCVNDIVPVRAHDRDGFDAYDVKRPRAARERNAGIRQRGGRPGRARDPRGRKLDPNHVGAARTALDTHRSHPPFAHVEQVVPGASDQADILQTGQRIHAVSRGVRRNG